MLKTLLIGSFCFSLMYIYIYLLYSKEIHQDNCIIIQYPEFCTIESSKRNCLSIILDKSICEKYLDAKFVNCYAHIYKFFRYCKLHLTIMDYYIGT